MHLTFLDVVLRLFCAFVAGTVIGYNRGEHGKTAGLRTTLLVCLAATVAMLQVNYLLTLAGRTADSFVMNDLMRLPLSFRVRETGKSSRDTVPAVIEDLAHRPGVTGLHWSRLE